MARKLTEAERKEYEKRRKESIERNAALLGITPAEIEKREAEARAKLTADDDWEKELDARNRAKAGIE